MATDFGIRVRMDEGGTGGVTSDQVTDIDRKVLQAISGETIAITHSSTGAYVAGDRTYNAVIDVNTITTADYGIEILIDSTVSASKKAEILRKILQVLASFTLVLSALNTTYAAGTTSKNQLTLTVT